MVVIIFFSITVQVKIWDPTLRGSELRATLKGHTKYLLHNPYSLIFADSFIPTGFFPFLSLFFLATMI